MDMLTLADAKAWLRVQVYNGGATCPCCAQHAKVYKRQINSGMARSLIRMYRSFGLDFGYIPELPTRSREEGKLPYWGLTEEANAVRLDGGRAGWWRVTDKGEAFIRRGLLVPKYALVYNGRFLKYDDSKQLVSIIHCLGNKFDLDDLLKR
jgi:hypothetical protein